MKKKNESAKLDQIFHALADSTRRSLLDRLAGHEFTITELAEPFDMTFAAVSKHIRVLERAGLVTRSVDGRIHRCTADLDHLKTASAFIEKYKKFWNKQLDVLESYLKQSRKKS